MSTQPQVPDLMPLLSRGKHRKPSKGACFMELASYLAGERWSDHPRCTHPLLAGLARLVNDNISDAKRPLLAELLPAVIGLNGDDVRVDARITLRCARTALPVACDERQRVMAVAVLSADRLLAELEGRDPGALEPESSWALEQVPLAAQWARSIATKTGLSPRAFRQHAAPVAVRSAVHGIAQACIPQPDELLYDLMAHAVQDTAVVLNRRLHSAGLDAEVRGAVCRLTGNGSVPG